MFIVALVDYTYRFFSSKISFNFKFSKGLIVNNKEGIPENRTT